jgi:hypothetical protein
MAMTSQWLGNLRCRSMAVEPKWEMSSLKLLKNFSAWQPACLPRDKKWSKSCKVDDVPWTLLFQSRTVNSCERGLPAKMLKPRWYDLLMIIKCFVTCEGRYGFIFLFHLRLLMVFMGFELSMPYYLHRSLFKMAKRYKHSQADTSLFHVGLIKMVLVYEFT